MKFGLIGHPIAHSLSPALFKAGYGGKYIYDLIQGDDFEASYRRFLEGYEGINVTAPFKEHAYAKADIISEECRLAKAANLLVKTPEGIKAYNSDFLGVRMWLQEVLHKLSCRMDNSPTVLVVGCGGAGKAAAAAAVSLGLGCTLMNRSMDRAERLAEDLESMEYAAEARPIEDFPTCFREADIMIYSIPTAIEALDRLTGTDFAPGKAKYILEANYRNPSFGPGLLGRMKMANPLAEYTEGRTWLLYQALTGYEIFTGEMPDLACMSDVL